MYKIIYIVIIFFSLNLNAQEKPYALFLNGNTNLTTIKSFTGSEYSVSFWMKSYHNNSTNKIFTLYAAYNNYVTDQVLVQNNTDIYVGGNNLIYLTKKSVNTYEWHHITLTVSSAFISLYINGQFKQRASNPRFFELSGKKLTIGNSPFKGKITDFRIYNKALSEAEVKGLFLKEATPSTPNLYFHWKLNEGSGNIAYDSKGTNNGTITNGSWSYDYPPYNGFMKLKEGIGLDSIGENGAKAKINLHTAEFGLPNGLMMYQYGNKDSNLVVENEAFPAQINSRSNIFWEFSKRGDIITDITFDFSDIKGIDNPQLVKILKRDSISDNLWEIVEETERNNTLKTITLKNVNEFAQYTIGYNSVHNYIFLDKPIDNTLNVDTLNNYLSWFSDSATYFSVFLDKTNPPNKLIVENLSNTELLLDTLYPGTKYYWRVVGYNDKEERFYSPTWSFTTANKQQYYTKYVPSLSGLQIHYNDSSSNYLIEEFTAVPNSNSGGAYGNTGFKYDKNNHQLIVNRFNWDKTDYVVFKDRNNNLLKEVNVKPYVNYIQGLALNSQDSSFWVAGRRPNWTSTSGLSYTLIKRFDKNGQPLNEISTGNTNFGMLDYVENLNALWVKDNDSNVANLVTLNPIDTIKTIDLKIAGEGIAISPFDSTFWVHNGTVVAQVSQLGYIINTFPSPVYFQGVNCEDITVDPTDYTIWVGADEFLHGYINGGNKIWHIDPFQTYNKDVFFPNMIHWRNGILGENLEMLRDTLFVKLGKKSGTWISPIINFKDYKPKFPITKSTNTDFSDFTFWFRGSDTPPTTALNNQHALDYYAVGTENEGWNSANLSQWSDSMPNFKYIQIKIEISLKNYAPTALPDSFIVEEEKVLTININQLLANDFDFDNYPKSLEIINIINPANGILTKNAENNYTYTPNTDFHGTDFFYYKNSDSRDSSNWTKVKIEVLNTNDQPQIIGQYEYKVLEDNAFEFDVNKLIVEDSDNNYPIDFSIELLKGNNYQIIDNKIVPTNNYVGTLNLIVRVNDGNVNDNLSNFYTVKINIVSVNDAPEIIGQKQINIFEDNSYFLNLKDILVKDVDNIYPINFSITASESENYSLNGKTITPKENFFGEIIVPIYVKDSESENSESSIFNLKIEILPKNDKPTILNQTINTILEDSTYQINLYDLIYSDIENNSVIIEIQNGVNYSVSGSNLIKPDKNFFGTLYVPVVLNDLQNENSLSDIFIYQLIILPVNDKPLVNFPAEFNFFEDKFSETYRIQNYISDIDNKISELQISTTSSEFIEIVQESDYFYFKSKVQNWFGKDTLIISVINDEFTIKDTFTVNCISINDAPSILNSVQVFKLSNTPHTISTGELFITDVEDNNFNNYQIHIEAGENYSVEGNQIIPLVNFDGTLTIPIKVSDSENVLSNLSYFYITYIKQESAAKVQISEELEYNEDSFAIFDITPYLSNYSKPLLDVNIAWIADANFIVSEKNKQIKIQSSKQNWFGEGDIIFYISNENISIPDTITVKCLPVNDAPRMNLPEKFIFYEDDFLIVNLKEVTFDLDNSFSELNFIPEVNEHFRIQVTDSLLTISNKTNNWHGIDTFKLSVSDSEFEIFQNITIQCLPKNDPPTLNLPSQITYYEDDTLYINLAPYISDIDNSLGELFLTWNNNSKINIEAKTNSSIKIYSNFENWNGTEQIFFSIFDGEFIRKDTLNIICEAINDSPFFLLQNNLYFNEAESLTIPINKIVNDIDNRIDELVLSIEGNHNLEFSIDNENLILSTKSNNWFGNEMLTLWVNDSKSSVSKHVDVNVLPVNDSPYFIATPVIEFDEDSETQFDMLSIVNDIDNKQSELFFKIDSITPPLTIATNNNHLTINTNQKNWTGIGFFNLTISDGKESIMQKIKVICNSINDSPIINIPDTISFYEDNIFKIDFSQYISDVDNKKSTLSLAWSTSDNIKIHEANLKLDFYNAPENWAGEEQMDFIISDNNGGSNEKTCKVIVFPINDAPIVHSFSPENEHLIIEKGTTIHFDANFADVDSEITQIWYLNNKKTNNNTNLYNQKFDSLGVFELKSIAFDSEYEILKHWTIEVKPAKQPIVEEKEEETEVILFQNVPNPFNDKTLIQFYLPNENYVNLSILNLAGLKVKELVSNELLQHSYYSIEWNGTNEEGNKLNAGVYFLKLQTPTISIIKKIVLLN